MVTEGQVRVAAEEANGGQDTRGSGSWSRHERAKRAQMEAGPYPSGTPKPHLWRTRADPFDGLFESEIVPLLAADEKRLLEARTLLGGLDRHHPGCFSARQLRTLPRRIRERGGHQT